jgi:capsular exopolysaccharide synthesis family protein
MGYIVSSARYSTSVQEYLFFEGRAMSELVPSQPMWRSMSPQEQITTPFPSWPVGEGQSMGLRDFCHLLLKHFRLIAVCFLGALIFTGLAMVMITPTYTATTTLLLERQIPQVLEFREVMAESAESNRFSTEHDFYKTQYEVLKSRTLAARIIQEQHLETSSVFAVRGTDKGIVARTWGHAKGWLIGLGTLKGFAQTSPRPEGEHLSAIKAELIDAYLAMLEVQPTRQTQLVKIAFHTPDPQLSARLADAHAEGYIRRGIELRIRAHEEARRFLEERLVELKDRVEQSEAVLNRYRRHKGIISLNDKENIVVDRLTDLNRRLTEAEAERIDIEGQVRLIHKGHYVSLPAVINNSLVQSLTRELARLEGEQAHLASLFKSDYPRLAQLQAQVGETRKRLQREIQRVVAGLNSAYQAANAKERKLRTEMEEQKVAALQLKDASVHYAILAREVDTNRQLYDSTLQRMKEMGVAAELRASNVSIIDKAEVPRQPSSPKIGNNLLLGMFLGLMGGVGLACLREYLDNTLKTAEEAERYLGLPNLAVIPDFLALSRRGQALWTFPSICRQISRTPAADRDLILAHRAFSAMVEAYGNLRAAILLSSAEESPKLVLFTSAMHGEGKTTTVTNTALVFARLGGNVLIIDADLRHSHCHKVLGLEHGPGLTELLTGLRELPDLIRQTHIERLYLLDSGSMSPDSAELLGSQKMRDVLAVLRERFDYILIDAPPMIPVSDAMLLSTMVDGVVLLVGAQTPKQLVWGARMRLSYARARILGAALNRANIGLDHYRYDYWTYAEHNGPTVRKEVRLEDKQ